MGDKVIGIDLGGTHIKGILMSQEGKILHKLHRKTDDQEAKLGFAIWQRRIKEMIEELSAGKQYPIGISAPGLPRADGKAIAYMPGRLQGLEDFDWSSYINNPKTFVLNDAVAALLAERNFGAAQGYQHVMMLTLGTGVGGALLIHGKPYFGKLSRAGHLGHISLNPDAETGILDLPGTLEYFVGNATIEKRSMGKFSSTHQMVEAYKAGDHYATQLWMDTLKKLAIGISSLINVISPELIILGGGISQAGNALFEPLQKLMNVYEWRPGSVSTPIVAAQMKEFAGAIGAAVYALDTSL
ncbi:MAG: ROK family protein [Bacteroidia bacterium]|nr:ROK family protein [Bacteroidia bacterium]